MIPIIDKSQFFIAISVIDELSPINFSDKCCGKFSMSLTKFILQITLQKCISAFFKKREQFTDSAAVLNKIKKDVFKLQQHFRNQWIFSTALAHYCNFEHCVHIKNYLSR